VLSAVAAAAGLPLLLSLWVVACRVFRFRVFRLKSQFGLRTLLLAVVVAAVPSGWLAGELERARQQRALVERFRRYNYLDGGPRLVPEWLRTSLGKDFFAELEGVVLDAPETDAWLVHLRGLKNLQFLYLSGTPVTDDRVRQLQADLPECQMDR
jgi:hypothetical protein